MEEFDIDNFDEFLREQLKNDPEFAKEWEAMHPEREVMRAVLKARSDSGLTQAQLAELSGIPVENIRRMEQGSINPSVKLLNLVAMAVGKKVYIEFR